MTIRQIYMKALKPYAIFDLPEEETADKSSAAGVQLSATEKKDEPDISVKTTGFKTGRHAASEAFNIMENRYEFDKYSRYAVYTGFTCIDLMLGGIAIGDIAVVAGDGVSSFLLNIVRKNAFRLNKPVETAVFCLQKAIPDKGIHLICMDSHLLVNEIKKGKIKERDWYKLSFAAGKLSEYPLYFCDKLPSSIDNMIDRIRALKTEKAKLRLVILDNLEMITGDDVYLIGEGLRKMKWMANALDVAVIIGSSNNMRFKRHKRNIYERYADTLLLLRKNEKDYAADIITHEKNDARFDYDEKLRGVIKVCTGNSILTKYPVEVQVRNNDGLLGTAILQYMPQKGVFVNGKR